MSNIDLKTDDRCDNQLKAGRFVVKFYRDKGNPNRSDELPDLSSGIVEIDFNADTLNIEGVVTNVTAFNCVEWFNKKAPFNIALYALNSKNQRIGAIRYKIGVFGQKPDVTVNYQFRVGEKANVPINITCKIESSFAHDLKAEEAA